MESLAAVVVGMLTTMVAAGVVGLVLSRSRRFALRLIAMVAAVVSTGLGFLLATRVDSLGAVLLGGACAAAGVVAAIRVLRYPPERLPRGSGRS